MKKELLSYLKEEREISSYRIDTLKKGPARNYKARLLILEKEFIDFKFENLPIESLDDLREAVNLFKIDRSLFNTRYLSHLDSPEVKVNSVEEKISYFEDIFKDLIENKIREVNIVQNSKVRDFLNLDIDPNESGIDTISRIEGSRVGRKRARLQILTYCLARFIYSKIRAIKESEPSDSVSLDTLLDNIYEDLFKYYNDGIREVPLITNGTLGHNNMVPTVYPLINLFDKFKEDVSISRTLESSWNFYGESGFPIKKKFIERGYSLVTPIPRVGNEWMNLLYLDLYSEDGTNLNSIMTKEFYNYLSSSTYYKAISTIPVWNILNGQHTLDVYKSIYPLFGLEYNESISKYEDVILNNSSIINNINTFMEGKKIICKSKSKMLVAATRSESLHLEEALGWLKILINEIKVDYNKKFVNNKEEDND
jgi:hypothetical protein